MPVEELSEITGHWIWEYDVGSKWLLEKVTKPTSPWYHKMFAPEAEHWFRITEDGTWMMKVDSYSSESPEEERPIDIDGTVQEGSLLFSGELVTCKTCTYIGDDRLVTEWRGETHAGQKVYLKCSKEVVDGKYHSTVEDLVQHVLGTRVFRRYPWYQIENKTGEPVTLRTYDMADNVRLVASMTAEVLPGASYVDASAGDVEEEQAVFSLPDGRRYACAIAHSEAVTLEDTDFHYYPYYAIENLTGGSVTVQIYWASDFVYLVPAKTVIVGPGTSCVTASTQNASEEQAIFTLPDGRRSDLLVLKAYQTYSLDSQLAS